MKINNLEKFADFLENATQEQLDMAKKIGFGIWFSPIKLAPVALNKEKPQFYTDFAFENLVNYHEECIHLFFTDTYLNTKNPHLECARRIRERIEPLIKQGTDRMKTLYIMQAPPGFGKSYIAKEIFDNNPEKSIICSTDDFFMFDGEYKFDPSMLRENHKRCFDLADLSMKTGVEHVILDNTNIHLNHIKPYIDRAIKYGYMIDVIRPVLFDDATKEPENRILSGYNRKQAIYIAYERNVHGVPRNVIERMFDDACKKHEIYEYYLYQKALASVK